MDYSVLSAGAVVIVSGVRRRTVGDDSAARAVVGAERRISLQLSATLTSRQHPRRRRDIEHVVQTAATDVRTGTRRRRTDGVGRLRGAVPRRCGGVATTTGVVIERWRRRWNCTVSVSVTQSDAGSGGDRVAPIGGD